MKAAGKKQKGSRLERQIAAIIRHKGLDPKAKRMPLSGGFKHLPEDIFTSIPWHIEAKNQEAIRFWQWWDLTRDKCSFTKRPLLVISSNYRPIMAVTELEYFLDILKEVKDLETIISDLQGKIAELENNNPKS